MRKSTINVVKPDFNRAVEMIRALAREIPHAPISRREEKRRKRRKGKKDREKNGDVFIELSRVSIRP